MNIKTLSVIVSFVLTILITGIGYGEVKGKVVKNEENIERIYTQLEKQDTKLDKMIDLLMTR